MQGISYYIIGDIHGHFSKLKNLFDQLADYINPDDVLIFLGDYIDRGPESFEVIEFLIRLSKLYKSVFLTGNHEDMFIRYMNRKDFANNFFRNGGEFTIKSYMRNMNGMILPQSHIDFFNRLKLYYEADDFIAVHAGLNPEVEDMARQSRDDLIWIRSEFYMSGKRWPKTVIFGHTPTPYMHKSDSVFIDRDANIIGIDTCAMLSDHPLSCIRWPDRKLFRAY